MELYEDSFSYRSLTSVVLLNSPRLVESCIVQTELLSEEIQHQGVQLERPLQLLLLTQAPDDDVVLFALLFHAVDSSRQFGDLGVGRGQNFTRFSQLQPSSKLGCLQIFAFILDQKIKCSPLPIASTALLLLLLLHESFRAPHSIRRIPPLKSSNSDFSRQLSLTSAILRFRSSIAADAAAAEWSELAAPDLASSVPFSD